MKTRLLFLILGLASIQLGVASDVYHGTMTMQFGRVRNSQGKWVDLKGMQVPVTATRIYAQPGRPRIIGKGSEGSAGITSVTVYDNDNGDNFHFYTPGDASSLDDINLTNSGRGLPWESMAIGTHVDEAHRVLIRFIFFDSLVQGRGAGHSAFDGVIQDLGGYWTPPDAGDFKLTINTQSWNVSVADGQCYVAVQYRQPQFPEQGEGPFDTAYASVLSGGGVRTGNSDDVFWFDNDPFPNGIYDETEADNFGGTPNEANFIFMVATGGTQTIVVPTSATIFRGTQIGGELSDLWYSDNSYFKVQRGFTLNRTEPPVSVILESVAPNASVRALSFITEASVTSTGLQQTVELFNFTTNQYVLFDARAATRTDSVVEVLVGGNPLDYVNSANRHVRTRVSVKPAGPLLSYFYTANLDQTVWKIVTP